MFGFAAHLLFLRGDLQAQRARAGQSVPADPGGERITAQWHASGIPATSDHSTQTTPDFRILRAMVDCITADEELWGVNLSALPTFAEAVTKQLSHILTNGIDAALASMLESMPDGAS
ncbi:hypothetical protein [Gemmatimonas sp.]|uniref:hypothetical protein n=1 Tax=Gemmatimonas sp. TaxID=1962908 RepID=UPI0035624C23